MPTKDDIIEVVNETTAEILSAGIIGLTLGVAAYQAVKGQEITMPFELAMMSGTFLFLKKAVK